MNLIFSQHSLCTLWLLHSSGTCVICIIFRVPGCSEPAVLGTDTWCLYVKEIPLKAMGLHPGIYFRWETFRWGRYRQQCDAHGRRLHVSYSGHSMWKSGKKLKAKPSKKGFVVVFWKIDQKEDRIKIITIMSEQELEEIFRCNILTRKLSTETGKQWFGCLHPHYPVSPSGVTAAPGEPQGGSAPLPGLSRHQGSSGSAGADLLSASAKQIGCAEPGAAPLRLLPVFGFTSASGSSALHCRHFSWVNLQKDCRKTVFR